MQELLLETARAFLLATEAYNFVAHFIIFAGIRTVPRKDLVRSVVYFIQDTGSVTLTTLFFVPYYLWWISALQLLQHLGLIVKWDQTKVCRQVITWSSLESYHINKGKRFSLFLWDSYIGTLFDIGVHLWLTIHLIQTASILQILVAIVISVYGMHKIIFNPRFAWAKPGQEPEWVKKRMVIDVKYE